MPELPYTVIRSSRRTLAMEVKNGALIIRAPRLCPGFTIRAFYESNRAWAENALRKSREHAQGGKFTEEELNALKKQAKAYLPGRAELYAQRLGVRFGRISIRSQKTKWGSCSSAGNLNFNCLLMCLPPEVIDSVVVHEVCHLRHMDHSAAFYRDVYALCPEYKARYGYLKEHGPALMARLPE